MDERVTEATNSMIMSAVHFFPPAAELQSYIDGISDSPDISEPEVANLAEYYAACLAFRKATDTYIAHIRGQ